MGLISLRQIKGISEIPKIELNVTKNILWEGMAGTNNYSLLLKDNVKNYDQIIVYMAHAVENTLCSVTIDPQKENVAWLSWSMSGSAFTASVTFSGNTGVTSGITAPKGSVCFISRVEGIKLSKKTNEENTAKPVLPAGVYSNTAILWEGTYKTFPIVGNTFTLLDDVKNYDEIILRIGGRDVDTAATTDNTVILYYYTNGGSLGANFASETSFQLNKNSAKTTISKYGSAVADVNVKILGRKYAASDGSINDFTGATSEQNGQSGLVPQPTKDDLNKFLCGDGTWKSVGGSGLNISKEILWSGNENTATPTGITLSLTNDYTDYDYLLVYFGYDTTIEDSSIKNIGLFDCSSPYNNFEYVFSSRVNSSTVSTVYADISFSGVTWKINKYLTTISDVFINKIVGIKFLPNPNNYSTTEQEIGTWIDGKKMYQTTIEGNCTGKLTTIDIEPLNVETIVSLDGQGCFNDNVWFSLNYYESSTKYSGVCVGYAQNPTDKKIFINTSMENMFSRYYVTIRYTKA